MNNRIGSSEKKSFPETSRSSSEIKLAYGSDELKLSSEPLLKYNSESEGSTTQIEWCILEGDKSDQCYH